MSNAGYGNHDAPSPGSAQADQKVDRPGLDLGGAKDRSAPEGAQAGAHATPASTGKAPGTPAKDSAGGVLTDAADDAKTPGSGAMPGGVQGGEVDPGAG